jgi:hypothetical protein
MEIVFKFTAAFVLSLECFRIKKNVMPISAPHMQSIRHVASIQGVHQASRLSRGMLKQVQHDFVFLKAISLQQIYCRHGSSQNRILIQV